MKKLMFLSLLLAGALFLIPGIQKTAFAGHGYGARECQKPSCDRDSKSELEEKFYHKAHFALDHEEELGLSDAQVDALTELKHGIKKQVIQSDAGIEVLKMDIMHGLRANPVDVEALNGLIDRKYELKKEKARLLVQGIASVKSTLKSEQYEKMKELWKAEKDNG